jgi:hypothetical protein
MSDDEGAVTTLMGWCQSHGKPDQYHSLCRREYVTALGVLTRCGCPEHANDKKDAE